MREAPTLYLITGKLTVRMSSQEALYFAEVLLNFLLIVLFYFYLSECVNHSGMILMTEGVTNVLKREICVFSGQIHGQLSRIRINTVLSFREEITHGNIEIPGRGGHNIFEVDIASIFVCD